MCLLFPNDISQCAPQLVDPNGVISLRPVFVFQFGQDLCGILPPFPNHILIFSQGKQGRTFRVKRDEDTKTPVPTKEAHLDHEGTPGTMEWNGTPYGYLPRRVHASGLVRPAHSVSGLEHNPPLRYRSCLGGHLQLQQGLVPKTRTSRVRRRRSSDEHPDQSGCHQDWSSRTGRKE